MITPYKGDNAEWVDYDAMASLTDYLCSTKVAALFPVSGTGQWRYLSVEEKKEIIAVVIGEARGRKPVLAGIGSPNNMEETLEMARFAVDAGADALVVVTPYYIREQQQVINGRKRIFDQKILKKYFMTVCREVASPLVLYDPKTELDPETMGQLVKDCPSIIGIKFREKHHMDRFKAMVMAVKGKIAVLSGSESVAFLTMKMGGVGVIGSGLNLYPHLADDLYEAGKKKDWLEALRYQDEITKANKYMERLGGGAQGIKKILNDIIGVKMSVVNRGDTFREEAYPGEYKEILKYYRELDLPLYNPILKKSQ